MYYRHFGLDGSPFQFTPSARPLFLSKSHREGLAALEWGLLHEPSGFTVLVGETGTGKTTLIVSILARNDQRVRPAYVKNPRLGFDGLLREAARQYGIEARSIRFDMLDAFDAFLSRL
ncbi:MAG TPA: AAA family ATPase, partial [Candidatus Binataceae bacterium]|nr:AAA family ATPase [Candidatus Binataceae bacterium]